MNVRDVSDEWLAHYWRDLDAGRDDGWHVPEALDIVSEAGGHEIASHGFCHRPLTAIPDGAASRELAEAARFHDLPGLVRDRAPQSRARPERWLAVD